MTEPLEPTPPSFASRGTTNGLLAVIAIVLVCAVLKSAKVVVLPLMLAFFLATLLRPVLSFLNRYFNYLVSLLLVFGLLTGGAALGWTVLTVSAAAVADRGPAYVERAGELFAAFAEWAGRHGYDVSTESLGAEEVLKWGVQFLGASIVPVLSVLAMTTLVAFMLALLLLEAETLEQKVLRGMDNSSAKTLLGTVEAVMTRFQTYFFWKTVISLATGVATALATWALGIDFPFIWGALAFLLNFIPNIGSIIAVIPPVLVAALQFYGLSQAALMLVVLTGLQLVIGNFIDPRVMGRSLSLSPFVVFVSMVFWGWMWGIVGVFLAVPLTIGLNIAFQHIEPMRPIATLMEGPAPRRKRDRPGLAEKASGDPVPQDAVTAP